MKRLLFIFSVILLASCSLPAPKDDTDVPKFDTTSIEKKGTKVQSLYDAPAQDNGSTIVNPYDMVCGDVPPYGDSIIFSGRKFGFCSVVCLKKFAKKPSDYLK